MTQWKFTDETERGVIRTNADGSMESKLATLPDIVAAINAGQVLAADPAPEPEANVVPNSLGDLLVSKGVITQGELDSVKE